MKRDLLKLARSEFDLVVIGAGITGAFVAWDAALRGLRVALIDKGDFGHATSANSLKTVHGGLRYLQDGDLVQVRHMILERRAFQKIAPHLVYPMPFLLPSYGRGLAQREVMTVALAINDLMGFDRNRGLHPSQHLPRSRWLSKAESLELLPGLPQDKLAGSILWHDFQLRNTERFLLAIIQAASHAGAQVANYVEATGLSREGGAITEIGVYDHLAGLTFHLTTRAAVNCTGVWTNKILEIMGSLSKRSEVHWSIALNLVVNYPAREHAFGLRIRNQGRRAISRPVRGGQTLFFVPWQGRTMIGTWHLPFSGVPNSHPAGQADVEALLSQVNEVFPAGNFQPKDIALIHGGYLPTLPAGTGREGLRLVRKGIVIDHSLENGAEGLFTAVGVKYSSARLLAEQVVDKVCLRTAGRVLPCHTLETPVFGGQMDHPDLFLQSILTNPPGSLTPDTLRHLVLNYGSEYRQVIASIHKTPGLGEPIAPDSPVLKAEIRHAIEHEMAINLADIIRRRTVLGNAGPPRESALNAAADMMANELGWDSQQRSTQITAVKGLYPSSWAPPFQAENRQTTTIDHAH